VVPVDTPAEAPPADLIVLTAGHPRRAGMKRSDLLEVNLRTLLELCERVLPHQPQAKVLVVTNPADLLTWALHSRWPERGVFGLGCLLDTVRFRHFLAAAAGVSVNCVDGMVIGAHCDAMVPLLSRAAIGGAPAAEVLDPEQIGRVVRDTRQAGTDIVARLRTRGSYYAASHCIAAVAEAVLRDRRTVLPLTVEAAGRYGFEHLPLALPCVLGADGPGDILEFELSGAEREALGACAAEMQAACGDLPA
jgi:malate dehydrogenase